MPVSRDPLCAGEGPLSSAGMDRCHAYMRLNTFLSFYLSYSFPLFDAFPSCMYVVTSSSLQARSRSCLGGGKAPITATASSPAL